MTALEKYFFTPLHRPHRTGDVIRWWESRRLMYNVCVGVAGLTSIGYVTMLSLLAGRSLAFPWMGAVVYGVLANASFTLGPIVDLAIRRGFGGRAAVAGPALLRYGFVFSIGLTLLPIPVATLSFLLRLIF
jgi:hypothetical protein